jgi:hypothetical protein
VLHRPIETTRIFGNFEALFPKTPFLGSCGSTSVQCDSIAGMDKEAVAIVRRRLGMTCAVLGLILFVTALLPYLRYTANLSNLHTQERIHYAQALGLLWRMSFFGSAVFGFGSLFGLGWSRWIGILANAGAFICALMTLGAMCGPFNC